MPSYFQIRPIILDKKIFKVFPIYVHGKLPVTLPSYGHVFRQINKILITLVEVHPRTICAKLFSISTKVFGWKIFKICPINI